MPDETGDAIRFIPEARKGQKPERTPLRFEDELLTHLPRLRRVAHALARDRADADDLLQAAVERALTRRDQWQPGTRLDAWAIRILRNLWIDTVRAQSMRLETFVAAEQGEAV